MICLWFQKAHEYSLRMVYEILYLVHLIQQPIPKSVKVWILHPLCQAEQSTKTPMQKSKQTGRQTNMHEFWVHFCVMSPHRSPLPARSEKSHNRAKSYLDFLISMPVSSHILVISFFVFRHLGCVIFCMMFSAYKAIWARRNEK